MKFKYLSFIPLILLCLSPSQALAGIRPSFDLETCSWNASDIVVATEGKKIDGVFRVLEIWKGNLNPGDTIKIPELASFVPESARVVSDPRYQKEKSPRLVVTGDRMVLFLRRNDGEPAQETSDRTVRSAASIQWQSAAFYDEFNVSVVWIDQGKSFAFVQVLNPGPSLLIDLGFSEDEVKNCALEITEIRKSLLQTVAIADPATRAVALEPFAHHSVYQARDDAFEALKKCGSAAVPVLRRMLADDSLIDIHARLVEVLGEAANKDAGPLLAAIIEKDLEYWKKTGPVLKKGWWNGTGFDSLEEVEPFRDRYSRDYEALQQLTKRPYRTSEALLTELRDFWRSLAQLEEIDQLSKASDDALRELNRLKTNTRAVRFEGLRTFGESELVKAVREKVDVFSDDATITPDVIEKAKAAIRDYLTSRGHIHPAVAAEFDAASRALTFVIDEGKRAPVAEIGFAGNKIFVTEELRGQMKLCLAKSDGTGYDAESFDFCLRKLEGWVRSRGYLRARFHDPEMKEGKDGLVFTIQAHEGILYRLGRISIAGSKVVPPDQIRAMLGLRAGDIANGEVIGKALYEDLKKFYGSRGFIEYTAELNPTFKDNPENANEGIVEFEVTIDEGKQFRIHSISFSGSKLPEQRLRDLLFIREGEVFNQELYEKSIERLNESGLVDPTDKDGDVDFRTNGERGLIDLVIKVGVEDRHREPETSTLKRRQPEPPR